MTSCRTVSERSFAALRLVGRLAWLKIGLLYSVSFGAHISLELLAPNNEKASRMNQLLANAGVWLPEHDLKGNAVSQDEPIG